jgi:cyclopropane fatty-acyl-phospholipid synthase-like methyltransferase
MIGKAMFSELENINARPRPFEFYTTRDLWTNEHTSKQMLASHLDGDADGASRKTSFIDRSVKWITTHFKVGAGTKIADFGCGPGLYTTRLARKHADVTGIDFSKRSIEHAQKVADKEGLSIRYVTEDYLEYETDDRFHLILMISCDFCALSPVQRNTMLAKFRTLLEPDGSTLFGVHSLNDFEQHQEAASYEMNLMNGFWSANRYYGFLNTFRYEEEKVTLDKYTIIEAERTRTVYNWLQYFSLEALEREIQESGLTVDTFYSDVAGTPFDPGSKDFAVVARKA